MKADRTPAGRLVFVAGVLALVGGSFAQAPAAIAAEDESYLRASEADLRWWQEARFGLFIHWGPVSIKGTEIGWSRGGERRGREGRGQIPVEIYDNLYKEFNPVRFDADEWVALAQAAGMKYLVFTSKHHDGFSMFDSGLTDYKITNSPFERDVVAELAAACHKAGLRLGFYYSQPDWHHPDYRTERHASYLEYMKGQLRELCTNYGKVDIIWFDGLGGTAEDWDAPAVFKMIRQLQPHVLINNRAGLPADFGTPEQNIGKYDTQNRWESCITIGKQWAYKPNDDIKSLKECIHTLVRCAGGDGNLLFNVGPMPTGEIEPVQAQRLRDVGTWLKPRGESIYGTRGGPYPPGPWGASTQKGKQIYIHILDWSQCPDGVLKLDPLTSKVVGNSLLTGGQVNVDQNENGLQITVPPAARDEYDTIVVLDLAGPPATAPADKWARHYHERVAMFKEQNRESRNIVIVGSSHVEGFDAAKLLPGRRVVNRGIGADRIGVDERGILHRLDSSVFDCNPGFIILENGVNDLGELNRHGTPSMEEIDACFRKVVGQIRERLPDVPLLIVNLFPTRDRFANLKPLIVEFNDRLKKIAADHGCSYMDAYTPLADSEGLLRAEYSRDGLHLNPAGYRVWADMIEKALPASEPPASPAVGGN